MHHRSATLTYPAATIPASLDQAGLDKLVVSLVRVNGENAPGGTVGPIGELRVELSS